MLLQNDQKRTTNDYFRDISECIQSAMAEAVRNHVSSLVARSVILVCVCLFSLFSWARQVEVRVQDASGAIILDAWGSAHCGDQDLANLSLSKQIDLPDGEICKLAVHAQGFAEKVVTISPAERQVLAVLSPRAVGETMVVTASRSPLENNDLPISQTSKTQAEIVFAPALTVDDKLRQVAGFSLFRRSGSQTANPTTQGVSLRGLGASGASRSLVLEDGVPINDPFGGWVYWGRVPVESIQSVDILEGGASDLYGSNALGGVINIRTHGATQTAFAGETSYGSSLSPLGSGSGSVRIGNWGASLAGESFETNGYINVPESARGRVDTPVASQHGIADAMVEHFTNNTHLFLRGSLFAESRDNGTVAQFNNTTLRQLVMGADLQSSWGSFALRGYGGTQALRQTFSAVAADRNSEMLTTDQRVPVQQYGFTAQWSKLLGHRHMLVAGADGRDITGDTNELQYVVGKPSANYVAGGRQQSLGLFAEDIFQISNRWLLAGSVRGDLWSNVDASSRRFPFAGAQALTYFPNRSETALSPRLGLTRVVNDRMSVYVSGYRSFRAPTLNELYRPFRVGNVSTLANSDLEAEHFTGGEVGANISPTRSLHLKGTFFTGYLSNSVGNITLSTTPSLITRQRQNLGRVRTRGFEIESRADLKRYFTLAMNYVFTDATVVEFQSDPALVGLPTPQVPRQAFSVQAMYSNPRIVTLSIQGRAVSREFDDDRNQFVLDPYFNLGIYLSRNVHQHLAIFGAAENVLNSRYAIAKTPLETLAAPISVRGGLRFEYGATSRSK
jgi:outer membrane receptor protein involved in Fe transport